MNKSQGTSKRYTTAIFRPHEGPFQAKIQHYIKINMKNKRINYQDTSQRHWTNPHTTTTTMQHALFTFYFHFHIPQFQVHVSLYHTVISTLTCFPPTLAPCTALSPHRHSPQTTGPSRKSPTAQSVSGLATHCTFCQQMYTGLLNHKNIQIYNSPLNKPRQ